MKIILVSLIILGVGSSVLAGTISTKCSNSTGRVQVELTGSETVTLLGQEITEGKDSNNTIETKTFDSETTDLNDKCYKFEFSSKSEKFYIESNTNTNSTSYYTIQFEMEQVCRRTSTSAYQELVQPRTNSIKEALLCKEYRGF